MDAIAKAPSVSAGRTRCFQSPRPPVGKRSALSDSRRVKRIPRKNVGADCPTSATPIAAWSISELRLTAERSPTGTATIAARRNGVSPSSTPARGLGASRALGATESEVEAPDLELLVRVRRPLDVLLEAVVLVGLDHRDPRQVLEEHLRHLAVRLAAKLFIHREARRLAQLVEARVAPVVLRPARREEAPHHAVRIAERRGRVRPPQALEGLISVLLGADGVLDHLDLGVDADVAPHAVDRLGHRLVVGRVADGRLDNDLLALVAALLEPLACKKGGYKGEEIVI